MNISELVQAAHQNAVEKGWWDEERTYGELIGLVHSEVSEALEDYRAGNKPDEIWYAQPNPDNGKAIPKPCGIPIELADICIRIFDIAGKYGWADSLAVEAGERQSWKKNDEFLKATFAGKLNYLHCTLSLSFKSDLEGKLYETLQWLADTVDGCKAIAAEYGIDLDQAIAEKMAYNATRSHKHGGKVL